MKWRVAYRKNWSEDWQYTPATDRSTAKIEKNRLRAQFYMVILEWETVRGWEHD
jgi:hypothetical protein